MDNLPNHAYYCVFNRYEITKNRSGDSLQEYSCQDKTQITKNSHKKWHNYDLRLNNEGMTVEEQDRLRTEIDPDHLQWAKKLKIPEK